MRKIIMWLPKSERRMLVHYYRKLHESGVETRGQFSRSELEKCLPGKNTRNQIKITSNMLKRRNLLDFLHVQIDAVTVQLNLEGYDLGRKYSSWWARSGLRFTEYKNHWIWVIVSFFGGVLGGLLINWLSG